MSNEEKNPNHPDTGSDIKVSPIRDAKKINSIKKILADKPRDLAIFVIGINTNLRGVDLLKLTIGQLAYLKPGESFCLTEQKTLKSRTITINTSVYKVVQTLFQEIRTKHPEIALDSSYLFQSREGTNKKLTTPYLNNLVKKWCDLVGLRGNYGAHTLRKTFGYHQRVTFGVDIPTLMVMFNHSSQKQTLDYLGIQASEIKDAYMNEL